jgi:hypothetical protein
MQHTEHLSLQSKEQFVRADFLFAQHGYEADDEKDQYHW